MWAIVTISELFIFFNDGILFARMIQGRPYVNDFVNVYNAGVLSRRCVSGEKIDIYDPQVQDASVRTLIAPVVPEAPFYLQYPPWFFAWLLPLSVVPLPIAWIIWCLLGLSLLIITWIQALEAVGVAKKSPTAVISILAALASYPMWLSLELGQTSLIVAPALTAIWVLLAADKPMMAGLASGIVMIKVQYSPVVGLVGMIFGKAKYIAGLAIMTAINLLLSLVIVGADNMLRFPEALLHRETGSSVSGVAAILMQNFRGQLTLLFYGQDSLINGTAIFLFAMTIVVIAFLWWRDRVTLLADKRLFFVLCSITTLLMLMSSLHTHAQDYLMALPALFWLWRWNSERPEASRSRPGARFINAMVVTAPILSWVFLVKELFLVIKIEPFLLWAGIFVGVVLLELQHDRKQVRGTDTP